MAGSEFDPVIDVDFDPVLPIDVQFDNQYSSEFPRCLVSGAPVARLVWNEDGQFVDSGADGDVDVVVRGDDWYFKASLVPDLDPTLGWVLIGEGSDETTQGLALDAITPHAVPGAEGAVDPFTLAHAAQEEGLESPAVPTARNPNRLEVEWEEDDEGQVVSMSYAVPHNEEEAGVVHSTVSVTPADARPLALPGDELDEAAMVETLPAAPIVLASTLWSPGCRRGPDSLESLDAERACIQEELAGMDVQTWVAATPNPWVVDACHQLAG